MKKLICVLAVSALALMGCDAKDANAQNEGTVVGNPNSDNVLIIEEGYKAVVPVANPDNMNGRQPGDNSGAQTGAKSDPAKAAPANNNNAAVTGTAGGNNTGTVTVDETVSGMEDADGNGVYEVDESVSQD